MSPSKTESAAPARRKRSTPKWLWVTGGVAILVIAGVLTLALGGEAPAKKTWADEPMFEVKQGPLTISVDVGGEIRSSQAVVIKSEVDGRNMILSIVKEGTHVKAGDLLVELDSSELEDRRIDQEIGVQSAEASFVQARENLEVVKQQAQADISAAEVALKLAKLDLNKYQEGEYIDQIREAEKNIAIAEAELKLAADKLNWSKKLHGEGYITLDELQRDELDQKRAQLALEGAKSKLDLLKKYTYQRELAKLKSDVEQKEFLLTKANHKGQSSIVDAEATFRSKEMSFRREKEKLEKIVDQIAKCKIYSPVDGMVVYERGRRDDEPLAVGVEVSQRQELMRLPTTAEMVADVKIHESVYNKVTPGQMVRITTNALPDKVYTGRVDRIATQPDQQSRWLNPDLKVFNTEINILGDTNDLRPGMSCMAKIIVQQLESAMYVPIQAVMRVNGQPTLYKPSPEGPIAVPVEVGLDNNRMVHIKSGIEPGTRVMLDPPLPPSSMPAAGRLAEFDGDAQGDADQRGDGERSQRPQGDRQRPGGGERQGKGPGGKSDASAKQSQSSEPKSTGAGSKSTES